MIARLAAAAALLLAAVSPLPAAADQLIDNVNGYSIERDGTVIRFHQILIDDDGRVAAIYARGEEYKGRPDYRLDGLGRTMLPGMIDAHGHVMPLGLSLLTLDLSDTRSLDEALQKIADYAAIHPDRPWIIGRGWNQELWGLGRYPTAAELDAVVSDRPVWLERVDGHAGWANSLALQAGGVTAGTQDPTGGRIQRKPGSQAPEGVLVDNATQLIGSKVPPPRPEDRDQALYEAQQLLTSNGVTAVGDMAIGLGDWMTYRRAGDTGRLTVRLMTYAGDVQDMILIGGTGPTPWLYDDKLRLNGLKLFLDGALGSRGAWLKQPYADEPGNTGNRVIDGTQLRNLMSRAAMDNFQVAVHAIGDAANSEVLDAIEELSLDYKGDRRWRIEHAQIVDPIDIQRFGRHTTIASMQPVHETSDRLMAEARLGPDRLAGAYAWRSIQAAGAPLAFGSDVPVEYPNPFVGIAVAMTRQDEAGQPAGGWQPQEKVSLETALAAYTSGAAYAGFAEDRFGRLVRGQQADFIFVDRDPFRSAPEQIRDTKVLETWVGGRKVYDASERRK